MQKPGWVLVQLGAILLIGAAAKADAITLKSANSGSYSRIQKLDPKGANQYVFLTNVRFQGTPQLEIAYSIDAPGAVPEPMSLGLTGGALVILGIVGRRRKSCCAGSKAQILADARVHAL